MKIWAHTLIKNEARWLWFSVTSVIDLIDKVLIWDTGSTDGTLEIISELKKKYPEKIDFKQRKIQSADEFTKVRQEMLEATKADWFLVVDGDEIWWRESVKKVILAIKSSGQGIESIVVPTINLVGDIYHYQGRSAGKYKFGDLKGHYNLRAVKRDIPGLHSEGEHGIWGWADGEGQQIQDRNTFRFIDAPYLHATNLRRSDEDSSVIKRSKKYRYELGKEFPKDFFYPEALFEERPAFIKSPWYTMPAQYKIRAGLETPARLLKRKFIKEKIGY